MSHSLSRIIESLISSGLTEHEIAKNVKSSQPNIHRIKNGSEPKYSLGCRIVDFYESHTRSSLSNQ
ncbi:hypothetical protein [Bermanella sp. R86510]|uniref:hypothetical protein n=1 Tax=unclassified Bermanella TaxID=2627862 RepID=UPI0037CA3A27